MNGGRIEQIGTPMEVYERPETLFVAGFIGTPPMNLLKVADINSYVTNLPGLPKGTDIVGIRPDSLSRVPVESAPSATVTGVVELIEPLGGEFHVHLRPASNQEAFVAKLTAIEGLDEGKEAKLHVAHPHVHPFSAQTGRRTDQG
jgi:sn-glycerol 3-phosphate transport system ATP-binding protein